MRVFLIAVLATVVIAVGSVLALSTSQKLSGAAYTTEGARIKQSWTTKQMMKKQGPAGGAMTVGAGETSAEGCDVSSAWRLITVDFSESSDECS